MSLFHDGAAASSLPYSDRVRQVEADQPMRWLGDGMRDYLAAPVVSSAFGLVFAGVGLALAYALWRTPFFYLLLPLACGFMLLGPVATTGFQAISRDLERRSRPSIPAAFSALKANAGPIFYAALAFMLLFMAWLRISEILFALTFPAGTSLDAQSLLNATFFTADGLKFLALFVVFGFCVAALAFAAGAFSLSMLIDRPVGALRSDRDELCRRGDERADDGDLGGDPGRSDGGRNGVLLCRPRRDAPDRRARRLARLPGDDPAIGP